MYKIIEYKSEYRTSWNEFARKNGTVFHLIEWKEVLEEAFGYGSLYLMVVDEKNEIVGLVPIITGRNLLMQKVGISTPFVNYLDICCRDMEVYKFITGSLKLLLETYRLDYLEMRFKDQLVEDTGPVLNENNYTFILPLDGSEEQMLSYSSSSNRNHTRKAYRNNCFSVSFEDANLEEFYKVYCKTMKRLGSPAPDICFFRKIKEKLPDHTVLLTVLDRENNSVIGGMFLFTFADTIYYQWGGCLTQYNRKYVNNFMYWEAVKFGLEHGFKYLDLGRSPYNSGTYNFKKQWGAQPVKLKYYRFCKKNAAGFGVDREKLGVFIRMWMAMPSFITDFAGKILIKYIMP